MLSFRWVSLQEWGWGFGSDVDGNIYQHYRMVFSTCELWGLRGEGGGEERSG